MRSLIKRPDHITDKSLKFETNRFTQITDPLIRDPTLEFTIQSHKQLNLTRRFKQI